MIKVECSVESNVDIDTLLEEVGVDGRNSLLSFAADTAYKMMYDFVPKSKGYLIKGVHIPPGRLRDDHRIYPEGEDYVIEYKAPYSIYQYYGDKSWNFTTPGTGPYWDKEMMTAKGDDYIKQLEDYVKERLK